MSLPKIGVVNISDRASAGIYADEPGQACVALLREWLTTAFDLDYKIIPDEQAVISAELIRMADVSGCALIVTTGGTGPARAMSRPKPPALSSKKNSQASANSCAPPH